MSSLAGLMGLPNAPAYSASKVAIKAWGEAMRPRLARNGVGVSVICPGFVRTPLTARNRFPMPLLMEPEDAARAIRKGIARNQALIAFPWPLAWAARVLAILPRPLADVILMRLARKE
jgi:short-subunit dehydrogenase